tara:strand:+ start:378 stop:605 length:228 start_codon:yes stop_codon:yes gene_type:complete
MEIPNLSQKPDLTNAKTIVCEKCQGESFKQSLMLKSLSALVSPNGQESIVPVMVFACDSCGHVNEQFKNAEFTQG